LSYRPEVGVRPEGRVGPSGEPTDAGATDRPRNAAKCTAPARPVKKVGRLSWPGAGVASIAARRGPSSRRGDFTDRGARLYAGGSCGGRADEGRVGRAGTASLTLAARFGAIARFRALRMWRPCRERMMRVFTGGTVVLRVGEVRTGGTVVLRDRAKRVSHPDPPRAGRSGGTACGAGRYRAGGEALAGA